MNHKCGLDIDPGELLSQVKGDCKKQFCDITGTVILMDDSSDAPNDGKQCTADLCVNGVPTSLPILDGLVCPEEGFGVCITGECVECEATLSVNVCKNDYACDFQVCVPPHCVDPVPGLNGNETDHNCGGSCNPCQPGHKCKIGGDCLSGVCNMGKCQLSTCFDGVKNDSETGIDCGSPSCGPCGDGEGCATSEGCTSGVCWAAKCWAAKCQDGVLNGNETGTDCGGSCSACP